MSTTTANLGLFKYDTSNPTDLASAFNIKTALNNNWDKIDEAISNSCGARNIGEIVTSTIPLTDAWLHLLDGSLIQGDGIYSAFVDYIAGLASTTDKTSRINIVGSLTDTNGILSGFSSSNYCYPKTIQSFSQAISSNTWEEVFKFKVTSLSANQYITGGNSGTYVHDIMINTSGKFIIHLSSNGSSYDIYDGSGSYTVQSNTDYWVKLAFTGTQYILSYSLDGVTYTPDITVTSSTHLENTSDISYIGSRGNLGSPLIGTIDLNESYVNINGSRWWTGTMPICFTDEAIWQQSVSTYGVCGKFVYDSVNNTIRLPKITGIVEGTTDLTALGDLVEAGLPNITGNISVQWGFDYSAVNNAGSGALYNNYSAQTQNGINWNANTTNSADSNIRLDASRSSSIYGNSNTVQPQTIKAFYYIVIATSSKTDIQVDIDEIATDLNGKADTDLTNITDTGYVKMAGASMPSNKYVNLTLGANGSTYTAPADGWFYVHGNSSANTNFHHITIFYNSVNNWDTPVVRVCNNAPSAGTADLVPVKKGQTIRIEFDGMTMQHVVFIYAQGSESEAN